jgi:hypothetical protein
LPIYKLHHDNHNKFNVNLISSWNPKIHNMKTKAWSTANTIKPTKVHNMPTCYWEAQTKSIWYITLPLIHSSHIHNFVVLGLKNPISICPSLTSTTKDLYKPLLNSTSNTPQKLKIHSIVQKDQLANKSICLSSSSTSISKELHVQSPTMKHAPQTFLFIVLFHSLLSDSCLPLSSTFHHVTCTSIQWKQWKYQLNVHVCSISKFDFQISNN